jgi:hypothetical protein
MRWRRRKQRELNAGFDWREIVCASEDAAKAQAERQQALDDDDEAEWVYLHDEGTGQWLARRTPRHIEARETSLWEAFVAAMSP